MGVQQAVEARFGRLRPLETASYAGRIASNAALLADALRFGSDRARPEWVDNTPVNISAIVGSGDPFDLSRIYGVALRPGMPGDTNPGAHYVFVESHSMGGVGMFQSCSSTYCGVAEAGVGLSPAAGTPSSPIRGLITATPDLSGGQGMDADRAFDEAYDGATGYGDFAAPVDIRRCENGVDLLRHMRDIGHVFVNPLIDAYALELVRAAA